LAARGYDVHGVDISATAIGWARERFAAAGLVGTFLQGDVRDMPCFAEGSFDLVFDGACLHCLIDDDRSLCLAEARRLLASGGVFVVSSMCGAPRSDDAKARFDARASHLLEAGRPYRTLKPLGALEDELKAAGFEVLRSQLTRNPWWDHVVMPCRPAPGRRITP
jgi:ubiquinone/menaquinone biosynthesis C-methylase UbiE